MTVHAHGCATTMVAEGQTCSATTDRNFASSRRGTHSRPCMSVNRLNLPMLLEGIHRFATVHACIYLPVARGIKLRLMLAVLALHTEACCPALAPRLLTRGCGSCEVRIVATKPTWTNVSCAESSVHWTRYQIQCFQLKKQSRFRSTGRKGWYKIPSVSWCKARTKRAMVESGCCCADAPS